MNMHFKRPKFLILLLTGWIGLSGYEVLTNTALAEVVDQPAVPSSVGDSPLNRDAVSPTNIPNETSIPSQAEETPTTTVITPNANPSTSNPADINAVGGVGAVTPDTASPGGSDLLSNPRLFKILKDNPQLIEILRNNPQLIEILLKNPSLIPK